MAGLQVRGCESSGRQSEERWQETCRGGVRGRTGFVLRTAARLFLVLRAHRVSSCFRVILFARFGWFVLPLPPSSPYQCHKNEIVLGEWKHVWRGDLRATRADQGQAGHPVQSNSRAIAALQSSVKTIKSGSIKEQGTGSGAERQRQGTQEVARRQPK